MTPAKILLIHYILKRQKTNIFFDEKKIIKNSKITNNLFITALHIKILNYFNPELQVKDTESAVTNKLKYLLTELKDLNS